MSDAHTTDHYVAPFDDNVSFDELPDAPPKSRFRLSSDRGLRHMARTICLSQMPIASFRSRSPAHGSARIGMTAIFSRALCTVRDARLVFR